MAAKHENDNIGDIIDGFIGGKSEYYRVIETRVKQYVHHQPIVDSVDKEEIISDVIAALYRNLSENKFHGDSIKALEVYLFSIVKNTVAKYNRKLGRIQFWGDLPAAFEVPSIPYDSGVTTKDLSNKILAALDEPCRELLEYKFKRFWSDQEIADHFKKSHNAVRTSISRCIKKARELDIVKKVL